MSPVESKVRAIRARLTLFRFLNALAWWLLGGLALAVVLLAAARMQVIALDPWVALGACAAVALAGASATAFARRISLAQAALRADESLGLRERLSSAIALATATDPHGAVAALQRDAADHAQRIDPARDFRYRVPRVAYHLVWPAAAFAAAYLWMPSFALFPPAEHPGAGEEQLDPAVEQQLRERQARELRELARKAEAAAEETGVEENALFARDLERLADELESGLTDRQAAIAELSKLEDQARDVRREMARSTQPFRQIRGLARAEQTREMQQALKDQDFEDAAAKLDDMAQQLASMSAEQQEQLADELENLARQTQDNPQVSQAMQQAADALREAARQDQQARDGQGQQGQAQQAQQSQQGQDGQQAGEQQAGGEQAAPQQGQQGQQAGEQAGQQAGQEAGQQGQSAAQQALQQAAQSLQEQQQLMDQLRQLDQLQQQMQQQQSSMLDQQSQSGQQSAEQQQQQGGQPQQGQQPGEQGQQPGQQPGQQGQQPGQGQGDQGGGQQQGQGGGMGEWQQGQPQPGTGSGGPGQGGGEVPQGRYGDAQFRDELVQGDRNEGEILATIEIDAPAIAGESNVRYSQIYSTRAQRAADALRQTEIPTGYRNAVRDYFQAINPEKKAE